MGVSTKRLFCNEPHSIDTHIHKFLNLETLHQRLAHLLSVIPTLTTHRLCRALCGIERRPSPADLTSEVRSGHGPRSPSAREERVD